MNKQFLLQDIWPEEVEDFTDAATTLFLRGHELSLRLLKALAAGLGLEVGKMRLLLVIQLFITFKIIKTHYSPDKAMGIYVSPSPLIQERHYFVSSVYMCLYVSLFVHNCVWSLSIVYIPKFLKFISF